MLLLMDIATLLLQAFMLRSCPDVASRLIEVRDTDSLNTDFGVCANCLVAEYPHFRGERSAE
jgi:hypothetical protein